MPALSKARCDCCKAKDERTSEPFVSQPECVASKAGQQFYNIAGAQVGVCEAKGFLENDGGPMNIGIADDCHTVLASCP